MFCKLPKKSSRTKRSRHVYPNDTIWLCPHRHISFATLECYYVAIYVAATVVVWQWAKKKRNFSVYVKKSFPFQYPTCKITLNYS